MSLTQSEFTGEVKTIRIASLVEGDGEVFAFPLLIRRIGAAINPSVNLEVPKGFRHPSGSIRKEGGIERAISAIAQLHADHFVLVLIDCDDDCPADLGTELLMRVRQTRPDLRVSVVLAYREYETWFVATAESLAGWRNLKDSLTPPANPEGIRDAKGWLTSQMSGTLTYRPTQDQAALTSIFDIQLARQRSRSFRKLWKEIETIIL